MKNKEVKIRMLVFSGRPDPEWNADETLLKEINNRFNKAKDKKERAEPAPPVLGYRGFLILNEGREVNLPENLVVFKGVISLPGSGKGNSWKDIADLEQLLLSDARKREYADILEELGY